MQKLKAVIFDLDGTVANTLPLCITAFRKAIEPHINRSVSDEEIIATFGPSEEGTIMALAPDYYEQGVADYLTHYTALHNICEAPFEGIIPLLEQLKQKDIRTAMVTGKGRKSALISLEKFGLRPYFELLETGKPEGSSKPQGIKAILNQWADLDKSEVIYVGDAPSDVTACREAGIPIAGAAWAETAEPEQLAAMQPDVMFSSVEEFSRWLLANV
ncbi:HAD family hydrolase [Flavobacterium sp. RHBU_3]|uniref:HAD family hydrolase n=1 Tax=Flavobacterium sp. RHBU_3 TaxID=3391184 RepID=UPI00398479EE